MKLIPIGSNQTELCIGNDTILFSYKTPVAALHNGEYIKTNKKWSKTTSKHINKWLDGVTAKEVDQSVLDNLVSEM